MDIKSLFPDCVAAECLRIDGEDNEFDLHPEELSLIEHAVAKRQKEFAAGRTCARQALRRLGIPDRPLERNPDGSIAWPNGIVGALSHTRTWCAAAVARAEDVRGIGLDIETVARVKSHIWRKIITDPESCWLERQPAESAQQWVALMFSAKESVYKCLYPVVKKRMGFYDAVIVPDSEGTTFEIKLHDLLAALVPGGVSLSGRFFFHEGAVFTGIVLA